MQLVKLLKKNVMFVMEKKRIQLKLIKMYILKKVFKIKEKWYFLNILLNLEI